MKSLPLVLLVAALAFVAHLLWRRGASDSSAAAAGIPRVLDTGHPMRIETADGELLELEAPPQRILATNAGILDDLSVLVDPERVVALPAPAGLYSRLAAGGADADAWRARPTFATYSTEAVLALEPDLVLTNAWQSPATTAALRALGVPVLVTSIPRTWSEVLESLAFLGRILGVEGEAARVRADLAARVEGLRAWPDHGSGLRALSYANFGSGGTTAGIGTTMDVVFELAGIVNAASEAGIEGYGSLDAERLLALAPDVLVVGAGDDPEGLPPSAAYLREREELRSLPAIRDDRIVILPTRLFSTTSIELAAAAAELQRALDAQRAR